MQDFHIATPTYGLVDHMHVFPESCDYFHEQKGLMALIIVTIKVCVGGGGGGVITPISPPTPSSAPPTSLALGCALVST